MPPVQTTTIAQMAPNVLQRLQDPTGIFWLQDNEIGPALAEAISDLMLLIGRPTLVTNLLVTLQPNSVWQTLPANMLALTNVRTDTYDLRKTSLHSMDYTLASWSADWTADRADTPARWGQLGFTHWFVHPAPTTAVQVLVAGVVQPVQSVWPFDPATQSPMHQEVDVALEMYAAAYCRLKELGSDAEEGNVLRGQYLQIAQQLSLLEDRRDPWLFSQTRGVPTAASLVTLR